eukprot:c17718_g1_i1.p1 GENE.c17718_g1_i1~~c17718_g1_i1.p1  ORF type:complete len:561 (+),score=80.41 c17718_g1_i1:43-1725(+)
MCGIGCVLCDCPAFDQVAQFISIVENAGEPQDHRQQVCWESSPDATTSSGDVPLLRSLLGNRGPDASREITLSEPALHFYASTLFMRPTQTPQPVGGPDDGGDVLVFNGEIFNARDIVAPHHDQTAPEENTCRPDTQVPPNGDSDTAVLYWLLKTASSNTTQSSLSAISLALSRVQGPYAFIFWNTQQRTLLFGRDSLGRRSLVLSQHNGLPVIASVGCSENCLEIPPSGVFSVQFANQTALLSHAPHPTLPPESILEQSADAWDAAFANVLGRAVAVRVSHDTVPYTRSEGEASTAVLFSGGVDSAVIAALACRHMPQGTPLDLLTVHFDLSLKSVPRDRALAVRTWQEIRAVAGPRVVNLVLIDVTADLLEHHKENVRALLRPSDTVMDFNIGCALYFAAKGVGVRMCNDGSTEPYTSRARTVLLGSGADEQCAGYKRHARLLDRVGPDRLRAELQFEMKRLWRRNLGRDDRCVSDSGREPRHPFLDEHVIRLLQSVPMEFLVSSDSSESVRDKMLIRRLARALGLPQAAGEPKVAIQFGSLIAKHVKGTKGDSQYKF